jgi:LCP family protein required for cell wall assembly
MTGKHSIDGFVPRRPGGQLGAQSAEASQEKPADLPTGLKRQEVSRREMNPGKSQRSDIGAVRTNDISASLKSIDAADDAPATKRGKKRRLKREKKPKSKKRRIIKWSIIGLIAVILGIVGWILYKGLTATNNIFQGSILDIVQNQPLKEDENGRSNVLLLGTSEDDPGHEGAYLTDSMMIVSIDQNEKMVDMVSIPRDLHVEYGMACPSGYEGKINAYFSCVNGDFESEDAEEERLTKSREFIGGIFGLDIQYAVHVNNTVIKEAVNAVGGIDVDIQGSNGDPGILDRNFDWRCNYECYYVNWDNGVHHLNGEQALYLTMARGSVPPTYGLGNSNFDREANQQKVILALQQKAISTGTLTDVGKVMGLIETLGKNLRTNFATKEIRTLMQLGVDIPSDSIKRIDLFDEANPMVTTDNIGGASVVVPVAGVFNYTQLQTFIHEKFSANPITREGAQVTVLNASGVTGLAQREADELETEGFIVSSIGDAPEGEYVDVEIYQIGDGYDATRAKLEELFGVTTRTTTPPGEIAEGTNFVVVFGKDTSVDESTPTP